MDDKKYKFSNHAERELIRRGISKTIALPILDKPQQIVEESGDLKGYQSKVVINNKIYLVRLIVNETSLVVVTVYRTSKLEKYWKIEL